MYTAKQAAEDQEFIKEQSERILEAVRTGNSNALLGVIASSVLMTQVTLQIIARLLEDKS